ncbi:MAG: tetratricopeptide repeat protein [Gammaproteobacteria bacterium]|nr:tetratricopeptide repeat protein [Gammaproteobacteria bacterium]
MRRARATTRKSRCFLDQSGSLTRLVAVVLIVVIVSSCSKPPTDLSAAPEVDVAGMLPIIADVIGKAKKRQRKKPFDAKTNGELARLLHANELQSLADGYYARARQLDSADFRWAYLHGLCLEELGNTTAATAAFAHAVSLDPDYVPAVLKYAGALMSAGEMSQSGTLYESLLPANNDRADVHFFYGRWLLQNGRPQEAADHLAEALRLNGDFAQGHYLLASAYQHSGDAAKAGEHKRLFKRYAALKLVVRDPVRHALNELNASDRPHIFKAQDLLRAGKYDAAIEHFVRAAEANPKRIGTLVNLVMLYGLRSDLTNARQYYDAAVALDPSNPKSYFHFGNLFLRLEQHEKALALFEKALHADSDFQDARAQIAAAKLALGDDAGAIEALQVVLAEDSGHRQANFLYGKQLALNNGDYDTALNHLQRALEPEDRTTVLILHTIAGIQAAQGQLDKAIDTLKTASKVGKSQRVAGGLQTTINRQLARFEAMQEQNAQ